MSHHLLFPGPNHSEDSGADQPKLKPSHFLPPPLSLIDEIPALEDEQMTASLAVHRISTPEITPLKVHVQ